MIEKENGKITTKKRKGLPPEYIGKPGPGRPKGSKNFKTYFIRAWKEIAEALNLNKKPDRAQIEIIKLGFKRMFKDNSQAYNYWREFMERLFGKPEEVHKIELERKLIILDERPKLEEPENDNDLELKKT